MDKNSKMYKRYLKFFFFFKVTEIKINLPNGSFIAGKWWGSLDQKPILCLHGWQDNAGSFDRLIPLLPRELSFLAIDFPGHGKSSWLPTGVAYNVFDFIYTIIFVMKEYNWEKVSLLGHSMGAMVSFLFATLFPEKVNLLIKIDSFKKLDRSFEDELNDTREIVLNFLVTDERIRSNLEPPCYTITEMVERVYSGSFFNITKESAPYLLNRSIKRSSKYPHKFYFARDPRLRNIVMVYHPEEKALKSARNVCKVPFLFITTDKFSPLYARIEYLDKMIEVFSGFPDFQLEVIDSDSHYFHLNNPTQISRQISEFLIKHKKIVSHL